MISLEKMKYFDKIVYYVGNLVRIIVATGFEKLPKL